MDNLQDDREPEEIASEYLQGDAVDTTLGSGIDGIVYTTSRRTAIKIFKRRRLFDNELASYIRLRDWEVKSVKGHHVPQLINADSDLLVIEMTIVTKPFVLDFGKSSLDEPPADYSQEAWDMWFEGKAEEFGDNWEHARAIYYELINRYGIYHVDLSVNNVAFLEPAHPDGDAD